MATIFVRYCAIGCLVSRTHICMARVLGNSQSSVYYNEFRDSLLRLDSNTLGLFLMGKAKGIRGFVSKVQKSKHF